MNRYAVTITLGISAKTSKGAKRIMKEIVESGQAMGERPGTIAQVNLTSDPTVVKLPF